MTDTTEGQEQKLSPETEKLVTDAVNEAQETTPQEQQARKMGWRPEDEWDDSGEATWLPADDFIKRNERLKDRGDKILKAEVSKQTRQIANLEQTIKDLGAHLTKAETRAYQKALKEIEVKADKAVEEGDTDAYRRAKGEIKDLEQEAEAEAKDKPQVKSAPRDDPEFDGWLPDNIWYDPKDDGFDAEMAAFADSIAPQIGRTGLVGKPFYERIATEVKKKFPDHFGNQRRRQAPAVEAAGGGGSGNGKTLWSQVPKADQGEFKRFVGQGLYEDTPKGREKYADIYLNG
jgi:hypothetical protein